MARRSKKDPTPEEIRLHAHLIRFSNEILEYVLTKDAQTNYTSSEPTVYSYHGPLTREPDYRPLLEDVDFFEENARENVVTDYLDLIKPCNWNY